MQPNEIDLTVMVSNHMTYKRFIFTIILNILNKDLIIKIYLHNDFEYFIMNSILSGSNENDMETCHLPELRSEASPQNTV